MSEAPELDNPRLRTDPIERRPLESQLDGTEPQIPAPPVGIERRPGQQQLTFEFARGFAFEPPVEREATDGTRTTISGERFIGAELRQSNSQDLTRVRNALMQESDKSAAARALYVQLEMTSKIVLPRVTLDSKAFAAAVEVASLGMSEGVMSNEGLIEDRGAARVAYNGKPREAEAKALIALASAGVWNTPFAASAHASLQWPELRVLAKRTQDFLAQHVTAVLPFATEPDTAVLNATYARRFLPCEQVIALSADRDVVAEQQITRAVAGVRPVSQRAVLSCIDWQCVQRHCEVPLRRAAGDGVSLPVGSKGLTMLAGLLVAHARGLVRDRFVAFHDTDIVNPDHYDALRLMALPYVCRVDGVQQADSPTMSLIAKSGNGRNNQSWTSSMNLLASDPDVSVLVRKIARVSSSIIWPLSGERLLDGNVLLSTPWSTGMSIETNLNLHTAAACINAERQALHQVVNGVGKVERGYATEEREWNMMQMCRGWAEEFLRFCSNRAVSPGQLSLAEIRDFNRSIGGRVVDSLHQSPEDEANTVTRALFDYLVPTIAQLDELGAISWERLEEIALPSA